MKNKTGFKRNNSRFWYGNVVFLPSPEVSGREGLTEWKTEIGDCVQDLCNEALFTECRGMC